MSKGTERITINGKVYQAKELDFNFLCDLGDNGIDVTEIDKKMLSTVRVYIAYCMGVDVAKAGDEINQHSIKNGGINDLIEVFSEKAEDSDFFRSLDRNSKTDSQKKDTEKNGEEVSE